MSSADAETPAKGEQTISPSPAPEPRPSHQSRPGARVLACALCKQRRVKCSRTFPCSNCTQAGVVCVQPVVQQRRRRFAERALLDRLHHYEKLLRENSISFKPLHGPSSVSPGGLTPQDQEHYDNDHDDVQDDSDYGQDDAAPGRNSQHKDAIDVWQSIKRVALDDDREDNKHGNTTNFDQTNDRVKLAIQANDHLLFGAPNLDSFTYLPSLHPDHVQIFRLWQIYLDNVNPLLKVTHTPTLQPRLIDAAADLANINESLEALMFGIYCVAVLTLTDDQCLVSFQSSRDNLLSRFQLACKQAILKASPWRSNDRDCLTALYLYLLSVGSQVDPRSLACMVAVAIRIAQRMGIHYESSNKGSKRDALEAEMCRRLWWSLVLFDHRLCEIVSQEKSTSLLPLWDCRLPLNINDFEMQPNSQSLPTRHDSSITESLFNIVRCRLAEFVRHSTSHLTIIGVKSSLSNRQGGELQALEALIEKQYLIHCNPEVPLHFMTIWTTRSFFARSRLIEYYITHANTTPEQFTDAHYTAGYKYAVDMLECDTRLRTSPLTKGFLWFVEALHSPILAYLHILSGLAKRPGDSHADPAWVAICDNYEALVNSPKHHRTRLMFALKFSHFTLKTWEARAKLRRQRKEPPETPPRLVLDAEARATEQAEGSLSGGTLGSSVGLTPTDLSSTVSPASGGGTSEPLVPQFPSTHMGAFMEGFGSGSYLIGTTIPGFSLDMSDQAGMDAGLDQSWFDDSFKRV